MLTLCGSATAIGLAGCLGNGDDTEIGGDTGGNGDGTDDTGTGSDTDGNGDGTDDTGTGGGNGENGSVAGLTLADTPHTGRYEFEVTNLIIERFVWDVRDIDGDEATVDVTIDEAGFVEEETITVTPIIPDSFADGRPLNEDLDIDDLTNARVGDLWYPINEFANVDLSTLSVGDTWEETAGLNYEVTGTDSHAGLECLVVERRIIDELSFKYCVSTEHAMILYSADFDESGTLLHELTLTSYDG